MKAEAGRMNTEKNIHPCIFTKTKKYASYFTFPPSSLVPRRWCIVRCPRPAHTARRALHTAICVRMKFTLSNDGCQGEFLMEPQISQTCPPRADYTDFLTAKRPKEVPTYRGRKVYPPPAGTQRNVRQGLPRMAARKG
jgi:hypothetical protein